MFNKDDIIELRDTVCHTLDDHIGSIKTSPLTYGAVSGNKTFELSFSVLVVFDNYTFIAKNDEVEQPEPI